MNELQDLTGILAAFTTNSPSRRLLRLDFPNGYGPGSINIGIGTSGPVHINGKDIDIA